MGVIDEVEIGREVKLDKEGLQGDGCELVVVGTLLEGALNWQIGECDKETGEYTKGAY